MNTDEHTMKMGTTGGMLRSMVLQRRMGEVRRSLFSEIVAASERGDDVQAG